MYRVAHNAAMSHGIRRWAKAPPLLSLDELDERPDESDLERDANRRLSMDRLLGSIHRLKPLDRQIVLLYLEGLDAVSIGEVTGSSPGSIATKVHRLKKLLTRQFQEQRSPWRMNLADRIAGRMAGATGNGASHGYG